MRSRRGKKCARESSRMASRSNPFLYSTLGLSPAATQTATPTRGVIIFMTVSCPLGVGQGSMRLYLLRVSRGIILMSNSRQLQAMTPCAMTRPSSPAPWRPPQRIACGERAGHNVRRRRWTRVSLPSMARTSHHSCGEGIGCWEVMGLL